MMKLALITSITFATAAFATVQGFDISSLQPSVDFAGAKSSDAGSVIIKATEGDDIRNPNYTSHYESASQVGLIRGGYHSVDPGRSSGEAQANYFAGHGGGWSGDGKTLPGILELESGSGGDCWGLSATAMVSCIKSFSDQYHARQGVYPMLYTSMPWWEKFTGNSMAFANTNPLVLAEYSSGVTAIPDGWSSYAIWQNATVYGYGGNSDIFNCNEAALRTFASGSSG